MIPCFKEEELSAIESHLMEQIESRNQLAGHLDEKYTLQTLAAVVAIIRDSSYLPIQRLEFCLLNVIPADTSLDASLQSRPSRKVIVNDNGAGVEQG